MLEWVHVVLLVACFGVITPLVILVFWRCCCYRKRKETLVAANTRTESLQAGIAKLHREGLHPHHHHHLHQVDLDTKRAGNYHMFQRAVSGKPLFNWSDHPSLITDVVENGWSRFAFTGYMPSPSTRSSRLLGLCAVGDVRREAEPELSWEVSQGSADYMQKVRLNSGLKKVLNIGNPSMAAASVIRTALPLPGPPLGNSSFPQEAYFEITILYCLSDEYESSSINGKVREGEKTKLIQENTNSNAKVNSESLLHITSSQRNNKINEELKLAGKDDSKGEAVMLSMGLTVGGSIPLKLPGTYPRSIGFSSNGSVFLDGN